MQEMKRGSRWLKLSLATLLFLVSLLCGALAGFRFGYQRGARTFLEADVYTKVYQVGDLIERLPLDDGTTALSVDRLVESIEAIEPRTWMAQGGAGSVQFVPDKQFLVVSQNPWGHKQVELMLRTMRRDVYTRIFYIDYLNAAAVDPSLDVEAELEALKLQILTTVAPESWEAKGGIGDIRVFLSNLSIVVLQHEEIHRQVDAVVKARRTKLLSGERIYDVGTIVSGFADPDQRLERIGELITTTINPSGWKQHGGSNTLAVDKDRHAVVVDADAETQLQVIEVVTQLRHRNVAEMALAPARSE